MGWHTAPPPPFSEVFIYLYADLDNVLPVRLLIGVAGPPREEGRTAAISRHEPPVQNSKRKVPSWCQRGVVEVGLQCSHQIGILGKFVWWLHEHAEGENEWKTRRQRPEAASYCGDESGRGLYLSPHYLGQLVTHGPRHECHGGNEQAERRSVQHRRQTCVHRDRRASCTAGAGKPL
jgi:hypothetical protein